PQRISAERRGFDLDPDLQLVAPPESVRTQRELALDQREALTPIPIEALLFAEKFELFEPERMRTRTDKIDQRATDPAPTLDRRDADHRASHMASQRRRTANQHDTARLTAGSIDRDRRQPRLHTLADQLAPK